MSESIYQKYFLTEPELRNVSLNKGIVAPSAYIDSEKHFHSSANFSMAWRYITRPLLMDQTPHAHPFDQFLCFLGGNLENMFDFDADVELSLGEEHEKHVITKSTVVFIPKGRLHCPLSFVRIGKPVLFHPIALTAAYYSKFAENRRNK